MGETPNLIFYSSILSTRSQDLYTTLNVSLYVNTPLSCEVLGLFIGTKSSPNLIRIQVYNRQSPQLQGISKSIKDRTSKLIRSPNLPTCWRILVPLGVIHNSSLTKSSCKPTLLLIQSDILPCSLAFIFSHV